MVISMTGFARAQFQDNSGSVAWEIRSVNHRYLEINWRLPEHFRDLEAKARSLLQKRFKRGKFDCTLKFMLGSDIEQEVVINHSLANAVCQAGEVLHQKLPDSRPLSISDLLKWPMMLEVKPLDLSQAKQNILAAFETACDELYTVRKNEGENLQAIIEDKLNQTTPLLKELAALAKASQQAQREKLLARFEELALEVDQTRLEQELLFLAQKVDTAEEIDRLNTHFSEVYKVLKQQDAIGRRLDFLMQECHREANTLAAKILGGQATQLTVDLKVLIEQMREQVQNIE